MSKIINEYHIIGETPDNIRKAKNWHAAIGLQQVDGLMPSKYLINLAQENVDGNLSYEEIEQLLYDHYNHESNVEKEYRLKECDLVSTRIAAIFDDGSFPFIPDSLKTVHGILFKDLYDHAGAYRQYNISKEEPILNGRSVRYTDWQNIKNTLIYDFQTEKQKAYQGLDLRQTVKRITEFTSSIWQVHPFMEGNTRTTVVFVKCYLNELGFHVNNDIFKEHSLDFRNALVIANYSNYIEGIISDSQPLIQFIENLLLDEQHT